MKKTICALCLMLCLVPLFLLAQNQNTTFKRDFGYRFDNGLVVDVQMTAPGYYDENDHEFLNGPFKANGKETYSARGMSGTFTYSATGTYVENKLHGDLTIKLGQILTGSKKATLNQELRASYQNGKPVGTWIWTESGIVNGKSESTKRSITFKDEMLYSITWNDDYYIINQDGSITCKWNNESFKNGIDIKSYYRKTGAEVEMDNEVLNLINQYAEGKLTKGDLAEKGYGFKGLGFNLFVDIIEWVNDQLTVGGSGTGSLSYEIGSSLLYYDETFSLQKYINPNVNYRPCALVRVSVSSEETVMNAVKEWSDTENVETLLKIKDMINNNHFRDEFYFSDDVKAKVLEHIDAQLMSVERPQMRRNELRQFTDSTLEKIYSEFSNQEKNNSLIRNFMGNYDWWVSDTLKLKEYYEKATLIYNIYSDLSTLSVAMDSTLRMLKATNPILYKEYDELTDTYYSVNNCSTEEELESYYYKLQQWKQDLERCHDVYNMSNTINENSNTINTIVATYASASVKNYNGYIKNSLSSIQKNMLSSSDAMSSIIKQQENCLQYINELSKIEEKSNNILSCEYKGVLKAYQGYLKSLNLVWTAGASIQTLYGVQNVQEIFIKAINNENIKNIDAKIKKNKDKSIEAITRILEE